MRVVDIVPGTTVDGPGLRTSIYFAGCEHRCQGCHNPQTHDPLGGREMSLEEILKVVDYNGFDVTFSGGDPLYQIDELCRLAEMLKGRGYGIWCYTGYNYEHVAADPRLSRILTYLDVLVDGPFIEAERDVTLRFRGSRNQRLIDIPNSTPGNITLIPEIE